MILYRWFLSHRQEAESLVKTHSSESSQPWWILLCICKQFKKDFFSGNTWIFRVFHRCSKTSSYRCYFLSQELINSWRKNLAWKAGILKRHACGTLILGWGIIFPELATKTCESHFFIWTWVSKKPECHVNTNDGIIQAWAHVIQWTCGFISKRKFLSLYQYLTFFWKPSVD